MFKNENMLQANKYEQVDKGTLFKVIIPMLVI